MDAADAFEASVTVMEVGVADLWPFWELRGDGERKRGGRGGGGALKSISNMARGGGGSGPALEWTPG
jgi:hypothetical protein